MIFGSNRDSRLLLRLRRELLQDVIEQEILYYGVNLRNTRENVYGEAEVKYYNRPARLTCLIQTGEMNWSMDEFGPDMSRTISFAFNKEDFEDLKFRPDVGDIVEWHKGFYEIDSINENQFFVGKDEDYRLNQDELGKFGDSISVVLSAHLTRYTKLNIVDEA